MWRFLVWVCLFLSACAHESAHVQADRPAFAAEVCAPVRALAVPSQDDVKNWSHAVLDAYDRGQIAVLDVALSPQFVLFEGGKPLDRADMLAELKKRRPEATRIGSRSWDNEHVFVGPQGAVFIGEATERTVGNESHGGNEYDGWYKLVWVPAGDRYQLLFWGWQLGGKLAGRAAWDEVYRHGTGFDAAPNELLVEVTQELKPGRALDLGVGQGRNALYLAAHGWHVTGVDSSGEAIRLTRERAAAENLQIEVLQADFDAYDFGVGKWDLVTMLYETDNEDWIERSKRALKHGGVFVYEYFQAEEGDDSAMLAAIFKDGFEILRNEVVRAQPDWAQNEATLVRFVAKRR